MTHLTDEGLKEIEDRGRHSTTLRTFSEVADYARQLEADRDVLLAEVKRMRTALGRISKVRASNGCDAIARMALTAALKDQDNV